MDLKLLTYPEQLSFSFLFSRVRVAQFLVSVLWIIVLSFHLFCLFYCRPLVTPVVLLVVNPHPVKEGWYCEFVLTTNGTYSWSSVTHISCEGWQSNDGVRKLDFNVTIWNRCFSSIRVSANPLPKKSLYGRSSGMLPQMRYIHWYAGAAWMLLHLNGKSRIGELKLFL